tara:strand:+ start:2376 stop:2795 length:420 start_codon:yes stop_codon:yes gene_type:complete
MSLLAEAHLIFNLYTYYIYLNHFYEFVSVATKVNKTRKYILSFIYSSIKYEIEDDWEILEDHIQGEQNSKIHNGFKKSLEREYIIEKENNICLQEEIKELMLNSSSSPIFGQNRNDEKSTNFTTALDIPQFVLSNNTCV